MKKLIEIIKKKWLIDTTKTIILVAILIIAFIAINLGVKKLNLTAIDVTKEKLYSLTDESKEKVKTIPSNVNIYFFGIEDNTSIVDLARQYAKVNDKIQVEVIKSSERPDLIEKYGVTDGAQGIVVQAPERYKVLSTSDLSSYDYSTGTSVDVTEQKLTNALIDTTISKKPKLYFLTGHGETTKHSYLNTYLTNEVNDIATLDLLSSDFPEDCDCLLITNPTKDFTSIETDKIISYIQKGGKILWLSESASTDFTNMQKVLDQFGVSLAKGEVREQNSKRILAGDASYFIPDITYHSITEHIVTDGAVAFFDSTKITIAEDDKLAELKVEVSPLIQSSETSFFRTDLSNTSTSAQDNEEKGPFTLGAVFEKTIQDTTSKLILYSDSKFVTDALTISGQQIPPIGLYQNKDLILNSVAYLTDRGDSITIRKDTGSITYTATANQDLIIRIIIFAVPILIIIIGIIIWQIRRRKK